jgi:hypothetical protein
VRSRGLVFARAFVLSALAFGFAAARARAFQNPDAFAADPTQAGGGGRYFTGGPLDAYTCEVCHRPAQSPAVQIFGLPPKGYLSGGMYRVTIDWPDDLARVALTMEMTDRTGRAVGTWSDPDPATLTPADLCTLATDSPIPTRAIEAPGPRTIISAIDCGQHQITLNWTAPSVLNPLSPAQLPDAMLNGALVVSNTKGNIDGDSSATFQRSLAAPGAPEVEHTDVAAHCQVRRVQGTTGSRASAFGCAWFALVALCARRRRRSRLP